MGRRKAKEGVEAGAGGPEPLEALQERIGLKFRDRALLERALTHGSAAPEGADYQRLEFLGDRVLGVIVAERLFRQQPSIDEGQMAIRLNRLVNKQACARAARRMDLGAALRLDQGEERAGGRDRISILGDACEAVIAAVYIDQGLEEARGLVERFWGDELHKAAGNEVDPKSRLQEWAHRVGADNPTYQVLSRKGPDHAPTFTVEVAVGETHRETAQAGSKQDAEREAARTLLARVEPGL